MTGYRVISHHSTEIAAPGLCPPAPTTQMEKARIRPRSGQGLIRVRITAATCREQDASDKEQEQQNDVSD